MILKPFFTTAMAALVMLTLGKAQLGPLPDASTIPEACTIDCAAITQAATSCTQTELDPTTLATCFCSNISSLPSLSGCTTCLGSNGVPSLASSLSSLAEVCATLDEGLGSMTMTMTMSESETMGPTVSSTDNEQDGEGMSTMTDSADAPGGTGSGHQSGYITGTGKSRPRTVCPRFPWSIYSTMSLMNRTSSHLLSKDSSSPFTTTASAEPLDTLIPTRSVARSTAGTGSTASSGPASSTSPPSNSGQKVTSGALFGVWGLFAVFMGLFGGVL